MTVNDESKIDVKGSFYITQLYLKNRFIKKFIKIL